MHPDAPPLATAAPDPEERANPASMPHITALDGLRGIAVIAVIAFHADLLRGGYLGVDLFFVLSGYLITSLLLVEHRRRGSIDLAAFWTRRARRLLPALVVVVGVLAIVVLGSTELTRAGFRADAVATLLYVANWHQIASGGGYWEQFASPPLLEHAWSLAIEEQFYLVWPLVSILALGSSRRSGRSPDPDRGRRRLILGSLLGADLERLYLGTDTRIAAILFGASLACVAARPARTPTRQRRVATVAAGWVGAAVLTVAWILLDGRSTVPYRGGLLICGLAATAVIASVTTVADGRLATLLSWRPLVLAGLVSYGLYLWHWPVFVWLDEARVGWSGPPLLALQLAVTLALTSLSYRFVEMPIRRGAFSTRPALAALGAMAAILLLVVAVGRPSAPSIDAATAATSIRALGPLSDDATQLPRVLLLGDSVAKSLADGILPHQERFGIEAASAAVDGCGVARTNPRVRRDGTEIDETACLDQTASWRRQVEEWRPDAVLIVLGWHGLTERHLEGGWRRPCDPTFDGWYRGEVLAALDASAVTGSSVTIATAPYYRPPGAEDGAGAHDDAVIDCLNRIYRQAAAERPGVTVVDLADHVCPAGACRTSIDGVELRPDGLHFDGAASVWAADWLLHDQWRAIGSRSAPPTSSGG